MLALVEGKRSGLLRRRSDLYGRSFALFFVCLDSKVLGAGRGPLVRECLKASEETGVPVYIYAVEKNPNAVVTLQSLVLSESWANVEVVASDMRQWNPEEKADLVVSELLGSFGDNELSPECLDGAQRCLKVQKSGIKNLRPDASHSWESACSQRKLRVSFLWFVILYTGDGREHSK